MASVPESESRPVATSPDTPQPATRAVARTRIIVSVSFLALSLGYLYLSLQVPLGRMSRPGPGAYPVFLACIMVVVGTIAVHEALSAWRQTSQSDAPTGHLDTARRRDDTEGPNHFLTVLGALAIYVLVLDTIGFVMSTIGFMSIVGARLLPKPPNVKSYVAIAAVAIGTAFGLHWLLAELLLMRLPGS